MATYIVSLLRWLVKTYKAKYDNAHFRQVTKYSRSYIRSSRSHLADMRWWAESIKYRSNPGNMPWTMQKIRLPRGNMSYIIQVIHIMKLSALKDLDHKVGIDHLSPVRNQCNNRYHAGAGWYHMYYCA